MTDATGATVWTGAVTTFADSETTEGLSEHVMFAGKELDTDTGLYYYNARWYDPQLGRFITEDPIRDGVNWFVYVNNNPLKFIDPSGLNPQILIEAANKVIPYAQRAAVWASQHVPFIEQAAELGTHIFDSVKDKIQFTKSSSDQDDENSVILFRATDPSESKDIEATRKFRNPEGIDVKYFSTTFEGAVKEAKDLMQLDGETPYTVYQTSYPESAIDPLDVAEVDIGVPAVVVPTEKLDLLTEPEKIVQVNNPEEKILGEFGE